MGAPANTTPKGSSARRRLRRAVWECLAVLLVTAVLVAALDAGIRVVGPVLIVVAALSGARAVRTWWRELDENWFAAEVILVTSGWALFAAAFAAIQYLSFSLMPGAFFVEVDYGRMVSPRYRAEWLRDSSRAGAALNGAETAIRLLQAEGPKALFPDTAYPLPSGASLKLREQCAVLAADERCPWELTVTTGPGARPLKLVVEAPAGEQGAVPRKNLERELERQSGQLRAEIGRLATKLADPAAFVQPRITDFLYDTTIAFSGRDSGVFVPIGALARTFHVLESLASYLLFGIVVSRVAAAAGTRLARSASGPG